MLHFKAAVSQPKSGETSARTVLWSTHVASYQRTFPLDPSVPTLSVFMNDYHVDTREFRVFSHFLSCVFWALNFSRSSSSSLFALSSSLCIRCVNFLFRKAERAKKSRALRRQRLWNSSVYSHSSSIPAFRKKRQHAFSTVLRFGV